MAQKWPIWAKTAIFGHNQPYRPPMAGKSGTNDGSQWNTCGGTTLDAKFVRKMHPMLWKWPKIANFGPKPPFLAISGLIDPLKAGKSGKNGGSQWNTCGGTTLVAKLIRKCTQWHENGSEMANFGQKTQFLAISGPRDPWWLLKVEQMVDHSGTHLGGLM